MDTVALFDVRDHDVCRSLALHPEFAIDALCGGVEAERFFNDEFHRYGCVTGSGFQLVTGRVLKKPNQLKLPIGQSSFPKGYLDEAG